MSRPIQCIDKPTLSRLRERLPWTVSAESSIIEFKCSSASSRSKNIKPNFFFGLISAFLVTRNGFLSLRPINFFPATLIFWSSEKESAIVLLTRKVVAKILCNQHYKNAIQMFWGKKCFSKCWWKIMTKVCYEKILLKIGDHAL